MERINTLDCRNKIYLTFALLLFGLGVYISGTMDLSYDETYYWVYSKYLSWGYFDHPPAVAWSIALGTSLFGDNEFGVRFISQCFLFATALVVTFLVGDKKHFTTSLLLLLSMPLISLTGMVALPDAPLMFFSSLFFFLIKKYLDHDHWLNVLGLSLTIALMFYSKYHGLLIVLLTLCGYPLFLKRKSFWIIILIVIALYLPHIYWQYLHDFVSFKFHLFGRVEKHFSFNNILNYLVGQFILMGAPLFALFLIGLKKYGIKSPFERILLVNSLGFLCFLFLMSFRNQIEANWTISCAIALVVLMAPYAEKLGRKFNLAIAFNLILFALVRVIVLAPELFVKSSEENRLNEIFGWSERVEKVKQLCEGHQIVGDNYQFSSRFAYALNQPGIPSLHFGSRESHYKILNLEKNISAEEKICYLTSKKILGATVVETGYKDAIHIISNTTLEEIASYYGTTYEEITRE